ncbi:Zn(2)-C6 fungal-type domain-containing protein [Fusarium falciforme]|uniref:Zn(2)-C6 fungal-type domain-containing protein n=1 Tax=Fusarium falciforme TaxID=195108 RepID=UPI002301329C|nr:Zn(2)-C6 fungal-type domain-containing protein [Fusarium falciforme]WAO87328.1 Zn(2)-C6 fungal-type domain-containing protein [Fusarium falciforme]
MPTLSADMYKPAPRRVKKTNIVRTRTGCITCRERRKKCDEKKPACSTCARLGKRCEKYKAGFNFKNVSFDASPSPQQGAHKSRGRYAQQEKCSLEAVTAQTPLFHGSSPINSTTASKPSTRAPEETASLTPLSESMISLPISPLSDMGVAGLEFSNTVLGDGFALWAGDADYGSLKELTNERSPRFSADIPLGTPPGTSEAPGTSIQTQKPVGTPLLAEDGLQNQAPLDCNVSESFDFPTTSPPTTELMLLDNDFTSNAMQPYQLLKSPSSTFQLNDNQVVYMDFWLNQCLPALHPIFKDFPILGNLPLVVTDTMMALSAGRLSRMLPQRKSSDFSSIPGFSFRPDSSHKTKSQKYYYSAIRGISDWVKNGSEFQTTTTLATLILFCYWESSMGNFRDFSVHSGGATKLIEAQESTLVQQGFVGYGLMAAWVRAQMNNWWRRMHFSTVDFQRKQDPVSISPNVELILDLVGDTKASVLVILCESLRIYSSAVVGYWDLFRDPTPTNEDSQPGSQTPTASSASREGDACLYPYTLLMKAQARKLNDWHTKLPLSQLPITSFHSAGPATSEDSRLTIEPLYFQSHDSAMNYAYYITARIIQSADLLKDQKSTTSAQEIDRWALILLQIASGIDWEECIRLNTFAIGFSGLLLVCAMHTSNPAIGLWIQNWLEERQRNSHLEEGSFPVLQILQVLRAVNHERARGRDLFAVFQTVDDGGGEGKFHSYHSQTLTSVMVYGKEKNTENMVSYSIPV